MDNTLCSICHIQSAVQGISIGTCKECRKTLVLDRLNFLKAAEYAVIKKTRIDITNLYANNRKAKTIESRRLLVIALFRIAGYNSRQIKELFNVRGREVNDSSIRHTIYLAEDLYSVDKEYKILVDDLLIDTVRMYITGDNIMKDMQGRSFDVIKNFIKEEFNTTSSRAINVAHRLIEELLYNSKAPKL
jgi:hypothetical protein